MRTLTLLGKSTTVNDPARRKPTPFEQLPDPLASKDHVGEVERLLILVAECDDDLLKLDQEIFEQEMELKSICDPWDREDCEHNLRQLCTDRTFLGNTVYLAAGDIAAHVQYLVREKRKDAIFLLAQQVTPEVWERVKVEVPGLMTGMGWMELRGGDCQF